MADDLSAVSAAGGFPPPKLHDIETVDEIFKATLEHFARKPGEGMLRMDDLYFVLKLDSGDFSNWKRGRIKAKEPRLPLRVTERLLKIFSGVLPHDVPDRQTYARVVDYMRQEHASPVLRVLLAMDVYRAQLVALHDERSRGTGKPAPRSEELEWGLLPPGPKEMSELESRGDSASALKWLRDQWPRIRGWDTFAHVLRLTEASGIGRVELGELRRLREEIPGHPEEDVESAVRYYFARILGQANYFGEAIDLHRSNDTGTLKLYPLRSQFEIAQLKFRVEDFRASRDAFRVVEERLSRHAARMENAPGPFQRLRVDHWKFLGTFERLHLVFDVPQAAVVLNEIPHGNAQRCLQSGCRAVELAQAIGYTDGAGWGHLIQAFAYEQGHADECAKAYEAALACHREPTAHPSSRPYTEFYRIGMLRRNGRLDEAAVELQKLGIEINQSSRPAYRAELRTQQALLTELREGRDAALVHHRAAIAVLLEREGVRESEWGVTRRVHAWCGQFGWRPEEFVTAGSLPA